MYDKELLLRIFIVLQKLLGQRKLNIHLNNRPTTQTINEFIAHMCMDTWIVLMFDLVRYSYEALL